MLSYCSQMRHLLFYLLTLSQKTHFVTLPSLICCRYTLVPGFCVVYVSFVYYTLIVPGFWRLHYSDSKSLYFKKRKRYYVSNEFLSHSTSTPGWRVNWIANNLCKLTHGNMWVDFHSRLRLQDIFSLQNPSRDNLDPYYTRTQTARYRLFLYYFEWIHLTVLKDRHMKQLI